MPAGHYAFVDLAVHAGIRERYARGEALVLYSIGLDEVLWANGAGAALFGFDSVYEIMDEWAGRNTPARRQLTAARNDAATGERNVMLRVASGLRSRLVPVSLAALALDDGTRALLLCEATAWQGTSQTERAERIVAGLGDDGTHVSVLDENGRCLAASSGLSSLDIGDAARRTLVDEVATAKDRLVKRRIATPNGPIPAAIARLADSPALHLVFAVEPGDAQTQAGAETQDAPGGSPRAGGHEAQPGEPEPASPDAELAGSADDPSPPQQPAVKINAWSLDPAGPSSQHPVAPDVQPTTDEPAVPSASAQPHEGNDDPSAAASQAGGAFVFDGKGRPVRFIWKIDAESRFSEISPDFATAVGPNAADIVGRHFADVARVFGIDRDGVISDLLERRDTWSGRSVLWPVEGTALSVPVDLAALPTYTRERAFDGFRGFGIVRIAEAVEDPEAIGLSLTATPPPEDSETDAFSIGPLQALPDIPATWNEATGESSPFVADDHRPDDPFLGETPALEIAETPSRRTSDKIIDLDDHRERAREPLSSGEQAAFREIGRRLNETFGQRRKQDRPETPEAGAEPESPLPAAHDAAAERPEADNKASIGPAGDAGPDPTPSDPQEGDAAAAEPSPPEAEGGSGHDALALPASAAANDDDAASAGAPPSRPNYDESLIDDLPIALLVHHGDTIHHANSEFFGLTGYTDLDALRAAGGMSSLFADADDARARPLPGMLPVVRADGSETHAYARLQSILWHNRHALMMSLMPAMPMAASTTPAEIPIEPAASEDREHIAALKVEVEELRSILETATDGVIILGERGDIRSMNRSASALFDYDEADTRGAPFAKLFAHESQRAVMDYLNGLSELGVASVLNDGREVIGREASGGFIPLFMTIGQLSGSKGYCAVMRDITQWKRTEEDLRAAKHAAEQASAHKSEFLARVSHEIRTPLNAIIGFSDMMAEERFGPIGNPRYLEYARDIGRSGKHVLDIVNDLLDISKIEAGEMDVEFAAVALNETVAETVSLLQPQANSQRVIIRTSLSSAVPEVVADQRSIKQIMINLLSNAIRFTPAGGQIVVSSAYEANGSVVLRIRDTGVGMSAGDLEQAMKPFRQVAGTNRPREGTGLGLPLTKAMVEANRAQFDIRSAPNEGTLVEISFPSQRVLAD